MADEKVIKIVAKVDGGGEADLAAEEIKLEKMREAARQLAKENKKLTEDLLKPFTFATQDWEAANAPKIPGKRGGARPGAGRKKKEKTEEEEEQAKEEATKRTNSLSVALRGLQKVVTALDGTNGRMTKALAAVHRSYNALNNVLSKHTHTVNQASKSTNAIQTALGTAKSALSGFAHGGSKVATVMISVASAISKTTGVVVAFGVAVTAVAIAAKLLSKIIENLTEVAGEFSGALEASKAQTQIAEIQARIRSSNRVGGDLAALEDTNRGLKTELINLKTEIVDLLGPFIAMMGDFTAACLKGLNLILLVINKIAELIESLFEKTLEFLSYIPGLGMVAKKVLQYMQSEDVRTAAQSDILNKDVEKLFDPSNVGLDRRKIPKQFLP